MTKFFQNIHSLKSISSRDGFRDIIFRDIIDCGAGHDEVWTHVLDKDIAINCEIIHKSTVIKN
jgi:hypothetical protein